MTKLKQTLLWIQEQPETSRTTFQKIEELLVEMEKPNPFCADTNRVNAMDDALVNCNDYVEILMECEEDVTSYSLIKNTELIGEPQPTIREALNLLVNER